MASMINDLPTPKKFGLGFNYATWTANSEITMCNVNWNSDYRDVVRFTGGHSGLNSFLDTVAGPKITLRKMTQLKWGEPIDIEIPLNVALEHNYIRVVNSAQPIEGDVQKPYYYFIQHAEYVAPNTTRLYIQPDAWQTFIYTTTFGNCYVERSHVGIANGNANNNYGRDYLTVPEGLDIGGEYQIIDVKSKAITRVQTSGSVGYRILVLSNVELEADPGTVDKPKFNVATGSSMQDLPNGANIYLFNSGSALQDYLNRYKDKPWVTQGIVSIQAIPRDYPLSASPVIVGGVYLFDKVNAGQLKKASTPMFQNWRDATRGSKVPARYRNLTKFMTYPYCVVELTSYTGTPLVLKPEIWNDLNATVMEVPHFAPPNPRMAFYPFRYNAASDTEIQTNAQGIFNDGGEFLDMTTGISNFPTFSTLNNSYAGFLAANANSLSYQHSSADWSQQKALTGAQLSQDQAGMGINASQDLNTIGVNSSMASTALQNETATKQAIVGAVGDVVGGLAGGPAGIASGAGSALMRGINTSINIDQANQAMGISTGASMASNSRSNQLTGQIADTNKGYADFASRGDYANTIAGINAKVQDAKLVQPTTSGQVGGESFLLANYQWGYDMKIKMLDRSAMRTVGEYWLRYGYNVSSFMRLPSDLRAMSKFTYWKCKETYITSARCPEEFRQTLRGIMEKGVTVWTNPNDIGNIDLADNAPLAGISY